MKKRRIMLAVVLCLCMALSLVPAALAAEETADAWDGTADTTWYTGDKTEYDIGSASALAGVSALAKEGNTFQGITLNLTTDVDLSGLAWTPIKNFQGTFNGGGHTVYNMYVELEEGQSGLFEHLYEATVKDLVLKQAEVVVTETNTYFYQGILAGWAQGSNIENCGVTGSITANLGEDAGGPAIGGLIGSCKGVDSLTNCWSTADVKTTNPNENAMVGGLVGQWENAATGAQIIDCYFGGTISVAEPETAASGILGAALSFNGEVVLISGCVSYGQITTPVGAEENAVHIVMLDEDGQAENCMWPDDGKAGVVRLIIVWEGNTGYASADPDFDETVCGQSVADFTDPSIIEMLNANAQTPGLWALGINGYPVFSTQTDLLPADYSAVEAAKAKIPEDLTIYTDETVNALNEAVDGVIEGMNKLQQSEVDAMAKAIEDAIAALEYKPADYTKVDEAIKKAEALNKDNYKDFSAVTAALNAVDRDKDITQQSEVDAMAKAIEDAMAALEYKPADYTKVDEAIKKAEALNKDDYKDFSAVTAALNAVDWDKNITQQSEVDAMAKAIEDAIAGLVKKTDTKPSDPSTPQTGDEGGMAVWFVVAGICAVGIAGVTMVSEKRGKVK